jgi:hypothetical protein
MFKKRIIIIDKIVNKIINIHVCYYVMVLRKCHDLLRACFFLCSKIKAQKVTTEDGIKII